MPLLEPTSSGRMYTGQTESRRREREGGVGERMEELVFEVHEGMEADSKGWREGAIQAPFRLL